MLCLQKSNPLNLTDLERVSVLSEALPYMQRFRNKVIVVKYGGAAMKDASLKVSLSALLSWPLQLSTFQSDTAQPTVTCGLGLTDAVVLLTNALLTLPGQASVRLAIRRLIGAKAASAGSTPEASCLTYSLAGREGALEWRGRFVPFLCHPALQHRAAGVTALLPQNKRLLMKASDLLHRTGSSKTWSCWRPLASGQSWCMAAAQRSTPG